jgi:tRNA(fMet)-specific endonuclease VapC
MTMLLLDTDICSYGIRAVYGVSEKLASAKFGEWAISSITRHELLFGINLPGAQRSVVDGVNQFLEIATTLNFDAAAANAAALVRVQLRQQGRPSGNFDELIAGHALSLNATLVTNNTKHFENVLGLKLESWL